MERERKTLLGLEEGRRPPPPAADGGSPSAPPGGAIAPPPYPGRGGYGGVVSQHPFMPPSYNIANQIDVKPPNYMVFNTFVAVCCCLLFGSVGLYLGSQIEKHWKQGNRELAYYRSKNAKRWGIGGISCGVVIYIIILIYIAIFSVIIKTVTY
ncbi:uncharacterized protein LOC135336792 [Halichondria panicea]|uniref:uncharacterized protein LOC135336792 n=1 Tax=Halichondria panicea TaxID=6063 RepID=UPI00312B4172